MVMNKPKYQIGDRLPDTQLQVHGVKVMSDGTIRYWLFAKDNGIIADENELELLVAIANPQTINYG